MAKREFLQKAHKYNRAKHGIGGWWWSEKLDGHRAFWDGGVTTGMPKEKVPWANTDKDERFVERQVCSGLWSQYGNVIHAPGWWIETLPKMTLDGELHNGIRNNRQTISSIVKKHHPVKEEWDTIQLAVFGSPPLEIVFADGRINNAHYKKTFKGIGDWISQQDFFIETVFEYNARFRSVFACLVSKLRPGSSAVLHPQHELSFNTALANEQIDFQNQRISDLKGEGLIVRNPDGLWLAERSHTVVKVKSYEDAEAVVVGYVTGRETDKGSRLLGLMGAMIVEWKGKIFEISGFTDEERALYDQDSVVLGREWATDHPETECPKNLSSLLFPRGSRVTFKYRGLTQDGIPNEASYWRKEEIL